MEAPGVHGQFDDCSNSSASIPATASGDPTSPDSLGGFGNESHTSGSHHGDARRLAVPVWVVVVLATVLPLTIAVAMLVCCCYCKDCPLYKQVGTCSPNCAPKAQLQVAAATADIIQMCCSECSTLTGLLNRAVLHPKQLSGCRSPH